jgi:histidinol phosphatase-like PHP family hydrolase
MLFDFHTHTFLSDGVLLPIEVIRRAIAHGYTAIGLTDHVSASNLNFVVDALRADCELAEKYWEVRAVPGVELTHLPPEAIPELAARARARGAQIVLVHGETPVEPVPPGTNQSAAGCTDVDILAHPGAIDEGLARLAAANDVFLEISTHRGHCFSNGAVVTAARKTGALLLLNSDTHVPSEILSEDLAGRVARGAGLTEQEVESVLKANPQRLLGRIAGRALPGEQRRRGPTSEPAF